MKIGKISKKIANNFEVLVDGMSYDAIPRGKIKIVESIFVGDDVEISFENNSVYIERVLPRKNFLLRPNAANIDKALIVIAKEPEPDLLLVDKIIINSYSNNIEPIICYNKADLSSQDEIKAVFAEYDRYIKCIDVSALEKNGMDKIIDILKDGVTCLAGQSAVGKTSIINAIFDLNLKTDGLSKKISRGKHSTRHLEIFQVEDGGMVMDTCGFNLLTLIEKEPFELKAYYHEFLEFQSQCRYPSCLHISEPDCAIIKAVDEGVINKNRYQRYKDIYEDLKKSYDLRYKKR